MFLATMGQTRADDEVSTMWKASLCASQCVEYSVPGLSLGISDGDHLFKDVRYLIGGRMRLDNRLELTEQLALDSIATDPLILLKSYLRWGEDCTANLLGDFAFFIYDQEEQVLFGARDQLGIVPFYYAQIGDRLIFGTNLKGILAHPLVPKRHDLSQVASYLSHLQYARLKKTFFRDVHKLEPGHRFVFTQEVMGLTQYWQPGPVSIRFKKRRDYVDRLDELIKRAVECRIGTATGVHLSGGLDSSLIAVHTSRLAGGDVTGFSWSSPPPGPTIAVDERHRILEICSQTEGLICQFFRRFTGDYVELLSRDLTREPTVMLAFEEPVQRAASKLGLTELLSGWGGDEFCSYNARGVLTSQFLKFRWLYVIRECFRASKRVRGGSLPRQFLRKVMIPLLQPQSSLRSTPVSYLHPSLLSYLPPVDECQGREKIGASQNMRYLFELGHLQERMEHWSESGDRYGLRYAYPLLDRRIVEFALSIPETLFHSEGFTRAIFRDVCARYLPQNQVWGRPKMERAVTLQWTREGCEEARDSYFQEVERRSLHHPYVDGPRLIREWNRTETRSKLKERAKACLFINPL